MTKINASYFDSEIGGCSYCPTDQELLAGPSHLPSLDVECSDYRLPPQLSKRPTPQHISPISFLHTFAHTVTKMNIMSKTNDTIQQQGLDWQTED